MPLIGSIGGVVSTLGNVEPGLGGPAITYVRTGYLVVTLNGSTLTSVRSARVSLGYDMAVSEASVVLAYEPASGSYDDEVVISMGAGNNNVVRFRGLLKSYDRTLFPRQITLVARGRLSRAAEFHNQYSVAETTARQSAGIPGVTALELLGASTATDEMLVYAALQRVDDLSVDPSNIGGTGTDLGGLPPDALAWGYTESALAFVSKIDVASQGYRTFESIGGTIFRVQISGWPSNDADFTFTEGEDITEGHSTRTILEQRDTARVDGYDYGIGAGIITFSTTPTSSPKEIQLQTSLAGRITSADTGPGFACEDIANYLLSEWDRELVKVTLTTPRDDVIGPGQTHLIDGFGAGVVGRLGVAEPLWVQRVDISVDERGRFRQSMTYLGGGLADGFDSPIDWSRD